MRTQLIVMAAFLTLAAACDSSRQGGLGESRASQEGEVPVDPTTPDGGGSCVAETCFDLSSVDHAISFVAIDGLACDGGELELSLFDADGAPMNVDWTLHGNGKSCEGLASTAQKFELDGEHHGVRLCVSGVGAGDVTLAVKAAQSCELTMVPGDCDCDETGGTGGADTVGTGTGTGGSDGTGGAPPEDDGDDDDGDDTSVTVGVTVGAGTGGSDGGTGGSDGGTGGCGGEDADDGDDGDGTEMPLPPT
jgi:hypothetical protein